MGKGLDAFWELLFPSDLYCICCGNIIDNFKPYTLCEECLEKIRWVGERTCKVCGKIMADDNPNDVCRDCEHTEHFFDKGFTCMVYGKREKEMVHKFKYNGAAYMSSSLGLIMLERIQQELGIQELSVQDLTSEGLSSNRLTSKELALNGLTSKEMALNGLTLKEVVPNPSELLGFDLVTAVPMHPKKQRKRGYNQAELLAKVVAKGLGIAYNNRVLKREYYKNPMNKLGAEQRHKNIVGAYGKGSCKPSVLNGKRVLLIDDVYTTGSTADECSRLLKEQGADKVYVLTLAAGVGD